MTPAQSPKQEARLFIPAGARALAGDIAEQNELNDVLRALGAFPPRRRCRTVPSRRGLKLAERFLLQRHFARCNTVPIEKGTETVLRATARLDLNFGSRSVIGIKPVGGPAALS
jgi:hypothetical protein